MEDRRMMKCDLLTHDLDLLSFADFLWFACDFGWANDPSFCSWTSDDTGSRWQIQSSGTPTLNTGPNMDHTGEDPVGYRLIGPYISKGQPLDAVHEFLSVIQVLLSNRWIRELHLHLSDKSPRDGGGSAGQPHGQLPGRRPVCVLLVPHVRASHWHTAYQTAQTDS